MSSGVSSGPSEKAVQAARKAGGSIYSGRVAVEGVEAAHDPALGLDRSVCLRDIVRFLDTTSRDPVSAREVEREFGGDS